MAFSTDKTRQGAAGVSTGDYEIDNSCRFNDDDLAYLSRTPAGAGNQKTWTWSGWIKKSIVGMQFWQTSVPSGFSDANSFHCRFEASGIMYITAYDFNYLATARVFRDPSAWYHVVVSVDTTESTDSDRMKLYVNGEQITEFTTTSYPSLNADLPINSTQQHGISARQPRAGGEYYDGYLAEVHFIDGTALDHTSFGESGDYGEWKPIEVSGLTYGTNGFYLDFADAASLGNDVSGEDNDWTVNNLTADDQMLDSPTNNFATMNPLAALDSGTTLSEGNLKATQANLGAIPATMAVTSGKWYWEVRCEQVGSNHLGIGVVDIDNFNCEGYVGSDTYGWNIHALQGRKYHDSSQVGSSVGSFANGDVMGVAVDVDNDDIWFSENGTWTEGDPAAGTGASHTNLSGTICPAIGSASTSTRWVCNFGQDSSFVGEETAQGNQDGNGIGDFYYTPPTGFLALCTSNLDTPAVTPSEHFNAKIYTGTGAAQVVTMGLQPDILWVMNRGDIESKPAVNSLGGATKYMHLDATTAEATDSTIITNFTSTGFTAGGDNKTSASGDDYLAFAWGGLTSSASGTTTGSGTGQAYSAKYNTDAGMSIIDYDGNVTAGHTIPHHLGVAPDFILVKHHTTQAWNLYIKPTGEAEFGWSVQFSNNWYGSNNGIWNDTSPTSTVFTVSAATGVNRDLVASSGNGYYAYCFASKDGFSKFGTYTGRSANDNAFVYTGFRPKMVLTKGLVNDHGWSTWDTVRELNLENPLSAAWGHSTTGAEEGPYSSSYVDLVANGFKLRNTQSTGINNRKYIYIAFAEVPFKHGNAR